MRMRMLIRDIVNPGSGIRDEKNRIRVPPGSATLVALFFILHFCSSWKQLTSVHNWRSCTALVGHQVAILNLFITIISHFLNHKS
jgi:hypothetical protein